MLGLVLLNRLKHRRAVDHLGIYEQMAEQLVSAFASHIDSELWTKHDSAVTIANRCNHLDLVDVDKAIVLSSIFNQGEVWHNAFSIPLFLAARIISRGQQFAYLPHMVSNPCFHRGSHAQARMHAAEVVVREVQCHGHLEIQQFFAESVR